MHSRLSLFVIPNKFVEHSLPVTDISWQAFLDLHGAQSRLLFPVSCAVFRDELAPTDVVKRLEEVKPTVKL